MNNNGREKIWPPEVWSEVDKAVLEEVGRIRVGQKVFEFATNGNGQFVPADIFDPETMTIADGETKPLVEISVEFGLSAAQLNAETTLRTGRTLARLAAKSLALVEDILLFQGYNPAELPKVANIRNGPSLGHGLLGGEGEDNSIRRISVGLLNPDNPRTYGEKTFQAVTRGISELTKDGQPGPYALFLESIPFADTYAPMPTTLVTTADRLIPLLTEGFYGTGTLPERTGLMVSLGGEPTSLYGQEAITEFTHQDNDGMYRFRVCEKIQFVARDRRAFIRLDFQ